MIFAPVVTSCLLTKLRREVRQYRLCSFKVWRIDLPSYRTGFLRARLWIWVPLCRHSLRPARLPCRHSTCVPRGLRFCVSAAPRYRARVFPGAAARPQKAEERCLHPPLGITTQSPPSRGFVPSCSATGCGVSESSLPSLQAASEVAPSGAAAGLSPVTLAWQCRPSSLTVSLRNHTYREPAVAV